VKKGSTNRDRTVGLDVSDKQSTYVVLDSKGQVIEEGKVATSRVGLSKQFASQPCRIAIEAGCHSPWISRLLSELGHQVIVANPRQVALIAKNQRKTDRLDAMRLARLARIDPQLLSPITHRTQQSQEDLEVLRAREQHLQARTALVNHVRAAVKSLGERLPACSAATFHRKIAAALPEALRPALAPVLEVISQLTEKIKMLDTHVLRLIAERYPAARSLMGQINGVGPLTALAFVLTIENPRRFHKSRDVGAYLGLTRRQRDSGDTLPQLHITKAGDALLRRLLIQCAHYILGPFGVDCDLRRWGLKLAGGAGKKRAIVAVARKLAVLMHRLWITGEVYQPLRQESGHSTAA
jgi:transposase